MWESEWRHHGDFKFKYSAIVEIVAKDPDAFKNEPEKSHRLSEPHLTLLLSFLKLLTIISLLLLFLLEILDMFHLSIPLLLPF